MHDRLAAERIAALRDREAAVEKQGDFMRRMAGEIAEAKDQMERERVRLTQLYAQFDVSISNFVRESEEQRRKHHDAQSHVETLRQSLEKDRKLMLQEIHTERKLLEQQHDEFVDRKMQAMQEMQAERRELARERSEWNLVK